MIPGVPPRAPGLPLAALDLPGLRFWTPCAPPGLPFGFLFEVIFDTCFDIFFDKKMMQTFTTFRCNLGSVLAPSREHFGIKII